MTYFELENVKLIAKSILTRYNLFIILIMGNPSMQ